MKFRVGYSWVTLKLTKALRRKEKAVGLWTRDKKSLDSIIQVDSAIKGLYFAHTLMHELGHVAEHVSGFDLKEEQIDAISQVFTEFLFGSGIIDVDEFEARVRKLVEDE